MDTILKSILETETGLTVYALEKPLTASIPAIVYQRISNMPFINHEGGTEKDKTRVQIRILANSYSQLRTVVKQVEDLLMGNKIDFDASVKVLREFQPEEKIDDIYQSVADFYIWN